MGTRGLTGFIADGKWYVMYNHFDSYPEWLGQQVLDWCKSVNDWEKVRKNVLKIKLVKKNKKPTKVQVEKCMKYYNNPNVSALGHKEDEKPDWYWLLYKLQGVGILEEIANGANKYMLDSHLFIGDSLFCEWAYIIDFDNMALRVYKGNQKSKSNSILPDDVVKKSRNGYYPPDGYYPCKQLYAYNLFALPEFMLGVTNKFKIKYRMEHSNG